MNFVNTKNNTLTCQGYCASCKTIHQLPTAGLAKTQAQWLLAELENGGHIDIFSKQPQIPLASLYGEARGKMFGVLECRTKTGETEFLYAYSGQFLGEWDIFGWAPPLFDIDQWWVIYGHYEPRIKRLSHHLARCLSQNCSDKVIQTLKMRRKHMSQDFMRDIHRLYRVHTGVGESKSLADCYLTPDKIPTGAGDCCAPKLINAAHCQGLVPVSIAEFFYGRSNRSGTKEHGQFYSSCAPKCEPLLGAMLCPKRVKFQ